MVYWENLVRPINIIQKRGEIIKSRLYPKIFFSVLLFAILLLAFYITKPFLAALVTGATIAYLAYPLYKKVLAYTKNKNAASIIVTLFVVLIFVIPSVVLLNFVSREAYATYKSLSEHNLGTNFMKILCREESWVSCRTTKLFIGFLPEKDLDYYMQVTIEKITGFIIENVSKLLVSIPSFLLDFFVMLFAVYYLLKDGDAISQRIKDIIPLTESHKKRVTEKFHDVASGVFYGNILAAILQGSLVGMGFLILGIPSPVLWGFVMMLFAFVPVIGSSIVWLPAALNLIFIGYLQNDNSSAVRGFFLVAYGIFVMVGVDSIIKPKLIGSRANVHPVLVLVGILGGLNFFGFIGLILGPVMLALLMVFIDIYEEEKEGIGYF